jgi:4'-phosphopantetheinyl transferase EntD
MHLDWYVTNRELDPGYADSCRDGLSHWHNRQEDARHRAEPLRHDHFIAVRQTASSVLRAKRPVTGTPLALQPL